MLGLKLNHVSKRGPRLSLSKYNTWSMEMARDLLCFAVVAFCTNRFYPCLSWWLHWYRRNVTTASNRTGKYITFISWELIKCDNNRSNRSKNLVFIDATYFLLEIFQRKRFTLCNISVWNTEARVFYSWLIHSSTWYHTPSVAIPEWNATVTWRNGIAHHSRF